MTAPARNASPVFWNGVTPELTGRGALGACIVSMAPVPAGHQRTLSDAASLISREAPSLVRYGLAAAGPPTARGESVRLGVSSVK